MHPKSDHTRSTLPRAAFSLVEILIVLAIMGILAGLAFALLGQTGQVAREAATKSGILAVHSALEDRMRGFENITQQMALADPDRPASREMREYRKRVEQFASRYNILADPPINSPNSPARIRIDWGTPSSHVAATEFFIKKNLFLSAFPQREEDLWGFDGVQDDYATLPSSHGIQSVDDSPVLTRMWDFTNSQWLSDSWKARDLAARALNPTDVIDDDRAESSELLYLSLFEGDVFGLPPADLDGIDQSLIGDTDKDGNLEFLDGWGRPLQFYNFPTRLFKSAGSGTGAVPNPPSATDLTQAAILVSGLPPSNASSSQLQVMNRDPMDNAGALYRTGLFSNPFRLGYTTPINGPLIVTNPAFDIHDLRCFHAFLVVSSGPDESLGMELPNSTASAFSHLGLVSNAADLADNISNRQKGPQ